ncbi:hypothetical protein [Legionella sp. WA2022007384]
MTTETTQVKPNYVIHIIYAAAFVLAVQIVVVYLIWNKIQINNEIKANEEKTRHEQEAQAFKEKERTLIVSTCQKLVSNLHKKSLTEACITQNNTSMKRYKNCLNEAKNWVDYNAYYPQQKNELYTYEVNECKRRYSMSSKSNSNCVLPKSIASKINADFNKMQQSCNNVT